MSAYEDFAQFYDTLMYDVDYAKWHEYINQVLNRYNVFPQKVLEMACGTGNFTKYLCEDGYEVTCFDTSDDMLSVAFDKLSMFKKLTILSQNMIDFELNEKFDLVLSICDSINYITDYEDLINVFANVYKHLQENGVFIFDVNSVYKLKEIIGNNTFVEDNEEVFYVWENEFDDNSNICEFYISFFIKDNEMYRRFDEQHFERAYTSEQIVYALKKAGFNQIEEYEGFSFEKPNTKSERLVFIVRK